MFVSQAISSCIFNGKSKIDMIFPITFCGRLWISSLKTTLLKLIYSRANSKLYKLKDVKGPVNTATLDSGRPVLNSVRYLRRGICVHKLVAIAKSSSRPSNSF